MITLYVARENTRCHTCSGNNLYTCINKEKNHYTLFQHFTYCLVHSNIIMVSSLGTFTATALPKMTQFYQNPCTETKTVARGTRRLFSVKYLFRRSQYWLEISIRSGRLNFSDDFSIHVCFLNRFMPFAFDGFYFGIGLFSISITEST